ncbi:GGDEF domain-containing protein [Methylophilus aquaticus]|uniref:GGDEF domain-containing protein n=1 Tax=Methylophilus aquaticus TaxID=1971610 RepID=A0ABT9JSD9_9PROT|nr:GGDEF domain-containing protein [Methylophilus aquaticus]MDP8567404.1 GGDEF domain-containing protein [Methylophilus aquaticus]
MNLDKRVDEALFHRLIASSPIPLIGSALGSLLVAMPQIGTHKGPLFIGWLCAVYAITGLRVVFTKVCQSQLNKHGYTYRLAIKYCLTIALSGIAWGALGFFVSDAPPVTVVLVVTAIQAMVMGGVVSLATFIPAFFAFSIPAILPLIYLFSIASNAHDKIIALYSAIFLLLMVAVAYRFNQSLRNSQRIIFENADLIYSLQAANAKILLQNIKLDHVAHHDQLTGLPNRIMLAQCMQQALEVDQLKNNRIAVLYIDLDGFKAINDTLGHDAGDAALFSVAQRLTTAIRSADVLARVGGDEFVILLSDLNAHGELAVEKVAHKCLSAFEQPFMIQEQFCRLGASIGLAICNKGDTPESLLAAADSAMYQAKLLGSGHMHWAQ